MATFAGRRGPEQIRKVRTGETIPGATVTVYEADGVTPATLWTDRVKATPLANPLPTGVANDATGLDVDGNYSYFAEPGVVVEAIAVSGTEVWRSPVTIDDDPLEGLVDVGLTSVATDDTATVTFAGDGTGGTPLAASLAFDPATQAELDAVVAVLAPLVDTAANLVAANPVLAAGQRAYAEDVDLEKIGNGTSAFVDLLWRAPALPETLIGIAVPTASGITTVTDLVGTLVGPFEATASVHWRVECVAPFVFPNPLDVAGRFANPRLWIADQAGNLTRPGFGQTGFVNTANQPAQCSMATPVEHITTPGEYQRKARLERMFGNTTLGQGLAGFPSLDTVLIATPYTP